MITEAELKYMQLVSSKLKGIEEQLTRIANALETLTKPSGCLGEIKEESAAALY